MKVRVVYVSRLMKGWEVQKACKEFLEHAEKAKEKADSAGTLSA